MTDIKNHENDRYLDVNLDRLLNLGKTTPEMPEDLKNDIRSRLVQATPESGKRKFLSFRWTLLPLGAAASLFFFLFFPWKDGLNGSISWADVQKHLENIQTVVSNVRLVTTYGEERTTIIVKVYHKDPGFTRSEIYGGEHDIDTLFPKPQLTNINKRVPGRSELLTLQPGSNQAEWRTEIFRTTGPENPPTLIVDIASENWRLMRKLTEDDTRLIGDRLIDGVPAVGFSFEGPVSEIIQSPGAVGRARGEIFVRREDGAPLSVEVKYRTRQGQSVYLEARDIQWNVPLEETLFSFSVPDGWQLERTRVETAEYSDTKLAKDTGLYIGLDGKEPLVKAGDVAEVSRVEQITYPESDTPGYMNVTIRLKQEAFQRLCRQAKVDSPKIIIVDFDGQYKSITRIDENLPGLLTFDLSWLNTSLGDLEKRYFTKTTAVYEGDGE